MALPTQVLPLACLMLLLLWRALGAGAQAGQSFQLQQPQANVSVNKGEMFTLTCTTSGDGPLGPVKWLKGWGSENETIYDLTGSFPRVTRAVSGSDVDFTIHIMDARLEDAGSYYCVKFSKSLGGVQVFQHGKGTEVSVHAKPSPPVVSGPQHRAGPGQSVPFTCTAGGFFPRDISVKWFKDRSPVLARQPQIITPEQLKSSYNMSSTLTVMLKEDDVRSQLICAVQHPTLTAPLTGTYQLSKALRVSPSVHVDADLPSLSEVNKTANFTCHVKGFYPRGVTITWLENGTEIKVENTSPPVETPQGLFELSSLLQVQATEEKNGSVFTCRVVHDAQDPISRTATLRIAAQSPPGVTLLWSPGLWLGILLEKGLLGGLLIFLFRCMRV
ncbi:tyrosine-protein phosphatase non-receptor type substrate 1-like [Falco peregrinus]|uniref:tyrosine-protein phosphatase non-receptor type substrate 1-like n=1 Tax=Falco peregrinus TaxID=8954 RepID=UPI00247A83C3|nr:tyrosine-protein phosphatase non-receptor type substrate 1-like [Falco peregrinus]